MSQCMFDLDKKGFRGYFVRAIGANNKYLIILNFTPEVKQQIQRRDICQVEIIKKEYERKMLRNSPHHPGIPAKNLYLL